MGDALRDKSRKQQLLSLRGRVLGRSRAVLGADPGDMSQPTKISKELYLESKYDTETLLYVLTERVALSPIGYNPHHAALASCCNLHSFLATASPLPAAGAAVIYTFFPNDRVLYILESTGYIRTSEIIYTHNKTNGDTRLCGKKAASKLMGRLSATG